MDGVGEQRFNVVEIKTQQTQTLTASTRLPALPCDNKLDSFPNSEGTVSDTGLGLWLDTVTPEVGLGLGPRLFPLLSLYLWQNTYLISILSYSIVIVMCLHYNLQQFFSMYESYQGPQLTEGKLVLSFSWELEPSSLTEGTCW